jgi:hypothetical protein
MALYSGEVWSLPEGLWKIFRHKTVAAKGLLKLHSFERNQYMNHNRISATCSRSLLQLLSKKGKTVRVRGRGGP